MNTAIAEAQKYNRSEQLDKVRTLFETRVAQIEEVLPGKRAADRFIRVVMTAIQQNPELLDCEPRSLWNQALRCATDGYIPDGRQAALTVFKDRRRGVKTCAYMPMVQGLTQAILKSPKIAKIETAVVFEGDAFAFELGDNPFIRHAPKLGAPNRRVLAAYSIATFRNGEKSREVMSFDEIEKARAVSRAEFGPWKDWYSEMARKTVLKRHAKRLPMSNDAELAIARDNELLLPEFEHDGAVTIAPKTADDGHARPPSGAAADQDDLDVADNSPPGGGVKDDGETFAQAMTRHAQTLTAAAKDGADPLHKAWAQVPPDLVEPLRDTYDNLSKQQA